MLKPYKKLVLYVPQDSTLNTFTNSISPYAPTILRI